MAIELQDVRGERDLILLAEGPIVFFDGVCGLCNRSVDLLLKLDRRQRFRFAPLQGETARQYLPPETAADLKSLVLLDRAGISRRSTAVARILGHLGGGWRVLGGLLWLIPRPVRDFGYAGIAQSRYRWFGKTEACRMPQPGERERFLP